MDAEGLKYIAIGLAVALGMLGPGYALGQIGRGALEGIARNPEAKGPLFSSMIIIAGLAEALGIYVLIIAIMMALVM